MIVVPNITEDLMLQVLNVELDMAVFHPGRRMSPRPNRLFGRRTLDPY
jgi:hypothetical protein